MHCHLQRSFILFYFYFTPGHSVSRRFYQLSDSPVSSEHTHTQSSPEKVQGPDTLDDLSSSGQVFARK